MNILNKIQNFIINLTKEPETNLQKILREAKTDVEQIKIENKAVVTQKSFANKNMTLFEYNSSVGFSNFIAGDLYIIKDSDLIYNKANVYNFELFGINLGKKPFVVSKHKYQKATQETIIDEFPDNYLLFVSYCEKVPYDVKLMPCDSSNRNSWSFTIEIYYNGELLKKIKNEVYRWKVNSKGEILLYHNSDLVKLNLNGLQQKIKVDSSFSSSEQEYYTDKVYSDDDNMFLYFFEKESELCYLLKAICKSAKKFEIIPNKFNDDLETINYKATFNKSDKDLITLLYFILEKFSIGVALSSSSLECKHCFGTAVNKIAIELYPKLLIKNNAITAIRQHDISESEKETNKHIIENIYNYYNLVVSYDFYPPEFFKDVATIQGQLSVYRNFVKEINSKLFTKDGLLKKNSKDRLQKEYERLKSDLVYKGEIKRKWTSEVELYKLVKTYYDDAIYQYHSKWLNLQSLDIYIPSLKIGIEYQGLQHYQAVECFGGNNNFIETQKRDQQKRELCKANGVKLIEWKYDEKIVKANLTKKINEILGNL